MRVYAFLREVDDIADGERPVQHKLAALTAWRRRSTGSMPDIAPPYQAGAE